MIGSVDSAGDVSKVQSVQAWLQQLQASNLPTLCLPSSPLFCEVKAALVPSPKDPEPGGGIFWIFAHLHIFLEIGQSQESPMRFLGERPLSWQAKGHCVAPFQAQVTSPWTPHSLPFRRSNCYRTFWSFSLGPNHCTTIKDLNVPPFHNL